MSVIVIGVIVFIFIVVVITVVVVYCHSEYAVFNWLLYELRSCGTEKVGREGEE